MQLWTGITDSRRWYAATQRSAQPQEEWAAMQEPSSARILVVDDSEDNLALLCVFLKREGYQTLQARGGLECLEQAMHELPSAVLLDINMPDIDGFETCRRLKNNPRTQPIPVLMVSSNEEDKHILEALDAGAHDYVTKPVRKRILAARLRSALRIKESQDESTRLLAELARRNDELTAMTARFQNLALEDVLTGLGNRRAMELELENIHASALRYQRPYSVALVDLDFFKRYNDHYGHQAGDELLRDLSGHFADTLRKSDRVYRYGGEEFLMLLPETPATGAAIITERLCASVAALGHEHSVVDEGCVTISAGVAHETATDPTRHDWQAVVGEADKALYMAKDRGRNRMVLWRPVGD